MRNRVRFSLLNALFLMTCVGMGLALWRTQTELGPLREEVVRLRNEAGHLTIEDPKLVHAIQIDTGNPLLWKWKVHLPDTGSFRLKTQAGELAPKGELPSKRARNVMSLGAISPQGRGDGPYEVTVTVYRDPEGAPTLRRAFAGISNTRTVPEEAYERLTKKSSWSHGGVTRYTQSAKPGQPLVLLRSVMRMRDEMNGTSNAGPQRGLAVWIEEAK